MRDLGLMGESAFAFWCANEGLSANRSDVDKTGWDFFVEFPTKTSALEIHRAALECRVQVKATDHQKRKLNIPLSNLHRLATAPTPCFYIFLEFDGKDVVQRAFLVHVDNELISRVLKKAYEIESSTKQRKPNKTTLAIHYDDANLIAPPCGSSLRRKLEEIIGPSLQDYIQNKKGHLYNTGHEEGWGEVTLMLEGEAAFRDFIDMSLGIKEDVNVSALQGFHTRFGIKSSKPFVDAIHGRVEILSREPIASGLICFKKEKYGPELPFKCNVFSSFLNSIAPESWQKIRVEAELFEITIAPFVGNASYQFTSNPNSRHVVSELRNAVQLLSYLSSKESRIFGELRANDWPSIKFSTNGKGQEFELMDELHALNCALKLISIYELVEPIEVSLQEISMSAQGIIQFYGVFDKEDRALKIEFSMEGPDINLSRESACALFVSTKIGDVILGVFLMLFGRIMRDESERLVLASNRKNIEKKVVLRNGDKLSASEFVEVADEVIKKYETTHEVLIFFPGNHADAPPEKF